MADISTPLGDYVEMMRQRLDPTPSMRHMSLEAGLGASAVRNIVKEGRGAEPQTVKALADRWGTIEDFREMMRLAGHPTPAYERYLEDRSAVMESLDESYLEDAAFEELLEIVMSLSKDQRRQALSWAIQHLIEKNRHNGD